jgi:hypothetical protein
VQVDRLSPLRASDVGANAGPSLTAIELILEETENASIEDFRGHLADMQHELLCDRALQREGSLRRNKRLVVMDMDSTLIINEVIDEIARIHGVYDEVSEVRRPLALSASALCAGLTDRNRQVTERAMNGELDFNESLVERVKCLAGAPESVFDDVYGAQFGLVLQHLGPIVTRSSNGRTRCRGDLADTRRTGVYLGTEDDGLQGGSGQRRLQPGHRPSSSGHGYGWHRN